MARTRNAGAVSTSSSDSAVEKVAMPVPVVPLTVKARVLAACAYGYPNDVVEIEQSVADALPGVVDTDLEAVAYAESLNSAKNT